MKLFSKVGGVLAVLLILSFATITSNAASSFRDLPSSHWAYENVTELVEIGAISGYPGGTFKPNQTLTYGEFIKMVIAVSYDDIDQIETVSGYYHWAEPFYDYMINKGIFTSSEISKDKVTKNISRKDMALIISRVLKNEVAVDTADLKKLFNDTQDENVLKVCGLGIISGYPDKTFRPDKSLTRAEASSVLVKIIDKDKRVQPILTQTEIPQVTPAVETPDGWVEIKQAKSAGHIKTRTYGGTSADKNHALVFTTDKTFLQDILRDYVEEDVSGVKNALYLNRALVSNDGCMYISNVAGFDKMRFSLWSYGHATVKIYGFTQDQYDNIKTSGDLKNLRNNLGDIVCQREMHFNENNHTIGVDFDGLSNYAGIYILLHSDVDEESVLQTDSHYVFMYNPEFSK